MIKLPRWLTHLLRRRKPWREIHSRSQAPRAMSAKKPQPWPALIAHVAAEDPWSHDPVVVAEVRSFEEKPHAGHRQSFCALVPMDEIEKVKAHLADFGNTVETSGPRPSPYPGMVYEPRFAIEAHGELDGTYEPLVLSWRSHDKTVLLTDPGFLMTYGLAQRSRGDGGLIWDEPTGPEHEVVLVGPPSTWRFPLASPSKVTIRRAYLQDYLSLRNVALVQVYFEQRYGMSDADTDKALGKEQAVELAGFDHQITIHRILGERGLISVQVTGARILAIGGAFPVSEDPLETTGLAWPGFARSVTRDMAAGLQLEDRVYVDDRVLAEFEGNPGYKVHPHNGAVEFGTQWSVGYCDRVARDLIRLELKKLYEGAPTRVVRHWHRFAVPPLPKGAYPKALEERNVGVRAKELVYNLMSLGESLSQLDHALGGNRQPDAFVGLKRDTLDYYGWWNFPQTEPLGWHVPLDMTMDGFLGRCGKIDQLVVEGLGEASLRALVAAMGVPKDALEPNGKPLRGLKLLDLVVRLAQVSTKTGLSLRTHGTSCWEVLEKEGTSPAQPIGQLFAVHDIRGLEAHKATDKRGELSQELERFGVARGDEAAGYGRIADRVYDALIDELARAGAVVSQAAITR